MASFSSRLYRVKTIGFIAELANIRHRKRRMTEDGTRDLNLLIVNTVKNGIQHKTQKPIKMATIRPAFFSLSEEARPLVLAVGSSMPVDTSKAAICLA